MDHVLAKVKRHKNTYFKLMSDHTLFEGINVNLDGCVEYNPDHKLDEDSWFKIESFKEQPYCLDFLKDEFDSKNYNDLTKEKFKDIAYLLSAQGDDYFFQKITPSLFIQRKIMAFGEVASIEETSNRLVINSLPDAIYYSASDTLIFKNLATISSIFKGIDELYKEATQEQVEEFLNESFIELTGDYDVNNVSKPNRKRLALATEALDKMSENDKESMFAYVNDYCEEKLNYDKETKMFEISNDNELKFLLYGIEQRFYTTPFGQERRLANSVQPLA